MTIYDRIGRTYTRTRQADPRIAARVHAALGAARSVLNVGAGAGSYEPASTVVAVEPSRTMIDQRPRGHAPAVQAVAEHIPLRTGSVDAAMAVLTVHHWTDLIAGLAELRRVARDRVVILTVDPELVAQFWLLTEYLPEAAAADAEMAVPLEAITAELPGAAVLTVPVPYDCTDGFGAAYWRRPEAYLDPDVRAGISMLAKVGDDRLRPGLARLADDIAAGRWSAAHRDLLGRNELDVGYRLVISELAA